MTQIKLSIAFVLAASAIAPIVAQPMRVSEGHEFVDNVGHCRHHGSHGRVVHSEPEIVAREYAEFEDMFERDDSEDPPVINVPYFNHPFPFGPGSHRSHPRFHFGPGLVNPPNRQDLGYGSRPRFRFPFNHGPVVFPGRRPTLNSPRFGLGVPLISHRPFRRIGPREYAETDDMFERDFEDVEFDARDFDDELYLD